MFRTISIAGFAIILGAILLHFIATYCAKKRCWCPVKISVNLLTLLLIEKKLSLLAVLRKLVYLLTMLCFVVLTFTGFFQPLVFEKHLTGYLVMLHATFAPIFAVCMAALAVMWASNCQFDKNYLPWFQRLIKHETANKTPVKKYEFCRKTCFWLIIVLTLPLILSMMLSMFPIFAAEAQDLFLNLHRYSALLFALIAIIHTYLLIRTKTE